jgi:hypothetical protein
MRAWRKTHPLTPEQRWKDRCRSYAGVYKRRGRLVPEPCEGCGAAEVEMHHDDYDQPLKVRWFCRPCHRLLDGPRTAQARREAGRARILARLAERTPDHPRRRRR